MPDLADELQRYQQAQRMARDLGMPPPERPRRRARSELRMPEVPGPARGAFKRFQAQRQAGGGGVNAVAQSLFGKLRYMPENAPLGSQPSENLISYVSIPEEVRKSIPMQGQKPLGWDPKQLDPKEHSLLQHLVSKGAPAQTPISDDERARILRISEQQKRAQLQAERARKLRMIQEAEARGGNKSVRM